MTSRRARPQQKTFQESARQALRAAGMRMTQQRDLLLDVITEAQGHLDADEIYRRARDRDPRLSLSTVYRTLASLKEHGLVSELHLGEEHHHYEARTGPRHYHLVCTSCGAVEEVGAEPLNRLRTELEQERGFRVVSIELDATGLCRRCSKTKAA